MHSPNMISRIATVIVALWISGFNSYATHLCAPTIAISEDLFTGTEPSFMAGVISEPFPSDAVKRERVVRVLPILERILADRAPENRTDPKLVIGLIDPAKLNFIPGHESVIDGTRYPTERTRIPILSGWRVGVDLTIVGNAIILGSWSDMQNINTVILFEGVNVVVVKPLTDFILSGIKNSRIRLLRNIGAREAEIWKSRNLSALHEHRYAYDFNALHFHLGNFDVYAKKSATNSLIIDLPHSVLVELNKQNLVRTGIIFPGSANWFLFEVVILREGWEKLMKHITSVLDK